MSGKKPTILVAEDEPDQTSILNLLLSKVGYNPLFAVDGEKTLEFLRNGNDISLAIFDYGLPDMNGPTLTKRVREDKKYQGMPVIIMSANHLSSRQQKEEAMAAGANCYMEKSVGPKELLAKIKELIGEKPTERAERY